MTVGLLGLQGAFRDHRKPLTRLNARWRIVRDVEDLAAVEHLIIPGGESTVMAMYLEAYGLIAPILERIAAGMPVWGICAGAILLAGTVDDGPGTLRVLDATVRRNAYGRHDASATQLLDIPVLNLQAFPAMFIRAPLITTTGSTVAVLGRRAATPVFVRQGSIMATTFHPELTTDPVFHEYFLSL